MPLALRTSACIGIGAGPGGAPASRPRLLARVRLTAAVVGALVALLAPALLRAASPGNRLAYLDGSDPFYVGRDFPRLTTPQWIGEPGVDAVVILAVDDMRDPARYEKFLRPILTRLQRIDGRAPVSIMVNGLTPADPQLQAWRREGLSLEVHTLAHPCPLCAHGNFAAAAATYHGCVDLLRQVPGNRPVAFRMPCCDSMNSPSPRFFAEMFNQTTAQGHFLTIDSSVMNLLTPHDPALPRALVLEADGSDRFRKYLPGETNAVIRKSMKSFVTTIEDYPYPYVIGRLCWEFPGTVPSDWEAFNRHGPTNPITVADWKAALDAIVLKRGVFNFIFHPHGWIRAEQMVEFIDYAVTRHGPRVKFLTFREAQERLDQNLLAGQPLRTAQGADNGVRLLDLNHDGLLDVVIGNGALQSTRVWHPEIPGWLETSTPTDVRAAQFGVFQGGRDTVMIARSEAGAGAARFDGTNWTPDARLAGFLNKEGLFTRVNGRDRGVRLRDLDQDGACEILVGNETQNAAYAWSESDQTGKKLPYALPGAARFVDADGRDAGLRFVDVDEDGYDDVLFSDAERFSLDQFVPKANPRLSWSVGWTDQIVSARRGGTNATVTEIPMIVRGGPHPDNGAWFHSGSMWVQNEDTAVLPDHVDRRTFRQLLTAEQPPPLSPEDSWRALQVRPGFQVELVAQEPLVTSPICFDWGADGRLWVVEMRDYPAGLDGKGKPGGAVRFLEDTDGDGRYDKSTVFLDGLNFPTGLAPWRHGVIVAAAPEIFYAEDRDGDGRAEVRLPLFRGFKEGNPQHRLNGFDYGLDGWFYGANGDSGGEIISALRPAAAPVPIRGRDFRLRPETGEFEAIAGQTQYGRHRDDWGNWFGNDNINWAWHYFLPEHYLARNPHYPAKSTRRIVATYDLAARCFPVSRTLQRFNDPAQRHQVTSGCSIAPYRDTLFGPEFADSLFICEPVHNLIHREVLDADGVTFRSRRAAGEEDREFLASTDVWFRPVMARTGPDGALYVADMYRLVLEHPEWITPAQQRRLDLRAGADKGRIYRVHPADKSPRRFPRLDGLDSRGLVAALDSPNGWQRDTAQRLLAERADPAAAKPLVALVQSGTDPKVRLQALASLDTLRLLDEATWLAALRDAHPAVREHAVRLGEQLPQRTNAAGGRALEALLDLAGDPARRVRYQLALSLGEWRDPRAADALHRIVARDASDPRLFTAAMSSAPNHFDRLLSLASSDANSAALGPSWLGELLALAPALHREDAVVDALAVLGEPTGAGSETARWNALAAFLNALERRGLPLDRFIEGRGRRAAALRPALEQMQANAARAASDASQPETARVSGLQLLARPGPAQAAELQALSALLAPTHPPAVQQAALVRLGQLPSPDTAAAMLQAWPQCSPGLRHEAITLLLSRTGWTTALLGALEQGTIPSQELDAVSQQRLLAHPDAGLRARATKMLGARRSDRRTLVEEYLAATPKFTGRSAAGATLFQQNCSPCHRLRGEGHELGPDLATVAEKPLEALLTAILDPNLAVEWRYGASTASTKAGQEFAGIVTSETPGSITLRAAGGIEQTILRTDLASMNGSKLSLMPEGFEQALPPEAMADLLAHIRGR